MTTRRSIRLPIALVTLTAGLLLQTSAPANAQTDDEVARLRSRLAQAESELASLERQLAERDDRPAVWDSATLPGTVALGRLGLFNKARIGITLETEPRPKDESEGAVIREIVPDGPADHAGLRAGDVITRWNGTELEAKERDFFGRVSHNEHLLDLARRLDPGDEVELEILRDGEPMTVTVVAEKAPSLNVASTFVEPRATLDAARALESARIAAKPEWRFAWGLGGSLWGDVEMIPLSPELGEYFDTDRGLLVLETPEGDAFGLRAGDVVLSIGEREPRDVTHATRILRSYDAGEQVNLYVVRKGERITLSAEVPEPPRGALVPGSVDGFAALFDRSEL